VSGPGTELGAAKETKLTATLAFLEVQLLGERLISELSVHQAKVREYDRVDLKRLRASRGWLMASSPTSPTSPTNG